MLPVAGDTGGVECASSPEALTLLQLLVAALPTLQKVPAPHVTHWLALLITSTPLGTWVPAGHGSGAAEPSAQ